MNTTITTAVPTPTSPAGLRRRGTVFAKGAVALGAGALLAIAAPLAASAHVTINPNAAEAGSYAVITVKVPNESATASTTNRIGSKFQRESSSEGDGGGPQ